MKRAFFWISFGILGALVSACSSGSPTVPSQIAATSSATRAPNPIPKPQICLQIVRREGTSPCVTPSPRSTPTPDPLDVLQVDYSQSNLSQPEDYTGTTINQGDTIEVNFYCVVGAASAQCPTSWMVSWEAYSTPSGLGLGFVPPVTYGSAITSELISALSSTVPGNYEVFTYFLANGSQSADIAVLPVKVVAPVGTTNAERTAIAALAQQWHDTAHFDGGYGVPCRVACVASVNNLVYQVTGQYIGSSTVDNTDQLKKYLQPISQQQAGPGDILIVDSADHSTAHAGICMDQNCVTAIANGSSSCTFTFRSTTNFGYPGSPYNGGIPSYWRIP